MIDSDTPLPGESVKEADTSCSIQPSSGECSDQQIEGEFGGGRALSIVN